MGERVVGWRAASLAARYDVVIVGDGIAALGPAWRLATRNPRLRVAVVAPGPMGASSYPTEVARLHGVRRPEPVAALVPDAGPALSRLVGELGMSRRRSTSGHLTIATTATEWAATRRSAGAVASCRAVGELTMHELAPALALGAALGAWYEPEATTLEVGDLVFRLARAAADLGVDLVDGATVGRLGGSTGRFELSTTAGSTTAATVVDAEGSLALSVAAGLAGVAVATSYHVVRTTALPPLLDIGLQIDGTEVRQLADGTVELLVPSPGPWAPSGLAAVASAVRTVVEAVPGLAAAAVVDHRTHREATAVDGLPVLGPVVDGVWASGGWGRHGPDVFALVSDALAEAVLDGGTGLLPAPFAPARLTGQTSPTSPGSRTCRVCGTRRAAEFRPAGGRWWHAAGCGRLLGADDAIIDLRDVAAGPASTDRADPAVPEPVTGEQPDVERAQVAVVAGEVPA